MRICLSIGHSPDRPGAVYNGYKEHNECALITSYLVGKLIALGHDVIVVPTGSLREKVEFINQVNPDVAIEVHLNAFVRRSAKGSETLYYPYSKSGKRLAQSIERYMRMITKSRGAKPAWYQGRVGKFLYFTRKTRCPSVIVEPFFLSSEIEYWLGKYDVIAEMIAKGIDDYILMISPLRKTN